jgi:hypothetical protein
MLYLVDRRITLQWLTGSMAATGLNSLFFLRADWSESMPVQLFTDDILVLIYLFIVFIYLLIYLNDGGNCLLGPGEQHFFVKKKEMQPCCKIK